MTNAETIAAELERIRLELANITYWRKLTVKLTEIRLLDQAERDWTQKAAAWIRLAEKEAKQ